jgi:hypothetical protein
MWSELDLEQMAREENACAVARTPEEVEQLVIMARLKLYNGWKPCGPKAVRERLCEHYSVKSPPSERTIARLLDKHGLSHARTGCHAGHGPDRQQTRDQRSEPGKRCEQSTVVL